MSVESSHTVASGARLTDAIAGWYDPLFSTGIQVSSVRVVILDTAETMSRTAAEESIHRIGLSVVPSSQVERPVVMGLATGGTPLGLYRNWIEQFRAGRATFSHSMSFNLDEYVGMPAEDPRSYHTYMRENLFRHIDIRPENTHLPKGDAADLIASANDYEWRIEQAGGIDYQILGLGSDGHIGFNEIGSSLASKTRVKTLTQRTRSDNSKYFGGIESVPTMAITMGIGTIMAARSILLLASGASKAKAIRDAVEGPVTSMVPASVLQLHPDVTIMLDTEASQLLVHREYYMESERNRQLVQHSQSGSLAGGVQS